MMHYYTTPVGCFLAPTVNGTVVCRHTSKMWAPFNFARHTKRCFLNPSGSFIDKEENATCQIYHPKNVPAPAKITA